MKEFVVELVFSVWVFLNSEDKFQLRMQIQYFLYETIQYYFLNSRIINVLSHSLLDKISFLFDFVHGFDILDPAK